ncbi:MAG: beta-ketoacyl-ACP synthase [Deltaproteobacteria bacterium]|nr:beta-ketoacyl-ACP synthase [Deltaproteobacteria bacterium]
MKHRVVVTGMAGLCPLGIEWPEVAQALREGRSGVRVVPELGEIEGMATRLGALVPGFEVPAHYPRKSIRSMGRVSLLATRATEIALASAGLTGHPVLHDGSAGISYGSTAGSPPAMAVYATSIIGNRSLRGIRATDYLQFMSHTVAANLAQFFGVRGRIVTACSACTSGSQGIGYGYEAIREGRQRVMITGGAEEFHAIDVAVFDVLFATSKRNDEPDRTPRPFDVARDGLVVAEGAATLVLEEREFALQRGAPILAEIVGWGTNCDGRHLTKPDAEGMRSVMELALQDASLSPADIAYVNAHGTATEAGDIAESIATNQVFGEHIPVSSLKGHLGHTLGACGAIEAWITIQMTRDGWVAPTRNLEEVDGRCAPLSHVRGVPATIDAPIVMSNNFAFGGVNTSLILRIGSDR